MSERLTPEQRERIRKYYQEGVGVFIRTDMPSCVLRLLEDLEDVERERDEAREAARFMHKIVKGWNLTFDTDDNEITFDEALERWPWLEETQ